MKDVAKRHKHIQKRGQSYGVRVPVPRHLQDILGKKEITRTLSTRDKKEAEKAYPDVLKRVYLEFEKAEAKLKQTNKASLSGFDPLTAVRKRHNLRREEILRSTKAEFSNDHEIEEARQRLREELVELTCRQIDRRYNFVETQAYDLLFEFGVPTCSESGRPNVDTADPRYHDLHEHLIASNIELKELALERLGEKLSRTPNGNIFSQSAMSGSVSVSPLHSITPLSMLIEEYMSFRGSIGKSKTVSDKYAAYQYLIELVGLEHPVQELTRGHFIQLREILSAYPKNANAMKAIKDLSLTKRSEYARAHKLPMMSKANANKILQRLRSLMEYAVSTDRISKNPCVEILFSISDTEKAMGEKAPFSIDQLQRLFKTQAFQPSYPNGPAMYWAPLIALFHGFRMEEILILTLKEIESSSDQTFLYFNLTEFTTDQLKNRNAIRRVPFHKELERLGFLDYLKTCEKNAGRRLFPELKRAKGADNTYRKIFSQKFSRYLEKTNVKTDKTSFHSFRRNFAVACTGGQVPIDVENALSGWSLVGGQGGTYKKPKDISLVVLKEMIDRVEFDGLDLSHLYSIE